MSYRLLTKNVVDGTTGEISSIDFKEIIPKSNLKRGFKMYYELYDKAQFHIVKGEKDLAVMVHIKNLFTKNRIEIPLNAREIAKKVIIKKRNGTIEKGVGQPKVSTVIKHMIECEFLMRVSRGMYRLNPYMHLPSFSNGVELQKEWDELTKGENSNYE